MAQRKTTTSKPRSDVAVKGAITAQDLNLSAESRRAMRPEGFAVAVRVLLQNWRQGTVSCKTRSEVSLTGRKPWKQKGTGRARAGTPRSPLWRGGGIIFGPQPRERTLTISRKTRQGIFNALLWDRLESQRIRTLDWAEQATPKTSVAAGVLKQAGLADKKVTLFVAPDNYIVQASFANIPNVQMLFFDQPNVYALAHGDYWAVLQADHESFKRMASSWI